MKNSFRIILLAIILFSGFTGPIWLFAVAVTIYAFIYFGVEIIIVGAIIDGFFGVSTGHMPFYLLGTSFLLLFAQILKPYISLYNR